jgi:MerR family mercuric resistance operon transcriptional regulator
MTDEPDKLTIGALAQAAGVGVGVGVETIRFYQRRGLLSEPARPYGSVRRYGPADVGRLRFVRRSQQLGFSLDEIAELLQLEDGTHCDEARTLAESKLAEVRRKLEDLHRMADALAGLIDRCCAARGHVKCPLIAGLQVAAESPAGDAVEQSVAAPAVERDLARRRRRT